MIIGNYVLSNFRRYGCLFYSGDAPPGSHPAAVEGNELSSELKASIAEKFSIGPVVDTAFWSKKRGNMDIDRGPCKHWYHFPPSKGFKLMII